MSAPVSSRSASRRDTRSQGVAKSISLPSKVDLRVPGHSLDDTGDQLLREVHDAVVVDAADEPLEHRELGVVLGRHALVAKELAELIDVLEAADDRPLEVELGRDPQEEMAVEGMVVGFERSRRGAAGQPLQDRRFQLDEAALVHVLADRREQPGA